MSSVKQHTSAAESMAQNCFHLRESGGGAASRSDADSGCGGNIRSVIRFLPYEGLGRRDMVAVERRHLRVG